MPNPPLGHVQIVDLTDLRGALAGRILADLGADVIKVEPPGGDTDRWRAPFAGNVAAPDRSLPFLYRNANKRGAVIDRRSADGWRRFIELCDRADILLENLGPDAQRAERLTPDEVRERHPHLVHVAIADFGLSGPRAGWRLEPLPAFAASGGLFAAGFRDRPPCWLPGYFAHDAASIFGALGALAAILDRTAYGGGQTVEVAVQEAALHCINPWSIPLADYARLYPLLPTCPPRNADGTYLVLPTADGYVRVLPGTARQWKAFVALLGDPEALSGDEWLSPVYRLLNGDVIRLLAQDALRERSRAEVFDEGRRRGVAIALLNSPDQFVAEEQARAREFFRRTDFPHLGAAPFASVPFRMSATPAAVRRAAPALGEDGGAGFVPRTAPRADDTVRQPVLTGLRVINLGVGAVGPEVCWALGELGAEVIKIESRANLDFLRKVTLEPDTPNRAWTFNVESRGQRSVCLDLRTPRGRELTLQLCATADVIVENNRGGVVRNWGLDYDDVRQVRPDVIYVASQGFGRGGPLGEAPSFGPLNSAFMGANWLWNHAEAPYPAGSALNHPDHMASKLAAVAVLAALEHRRRTGEGQFIEMAQTEAAAYLLGEVYLEGPCTGQPAAPRGNAVDYAVPHGVYRCAGEDRWVAIAVVGDDAWGRCAACAGWSDAARFATLSARLAARAEIDARLEAWTQQRSPEAVASTLQAAGVSAMIVQNPDDHRGDPHLAARGAIITVTHPEIGEERHIGNPLRLSRTPLVTAGAAPLLGADTEAVLGEVLRLSGDVVARLVADGVCW